jgi:hypothetical protein
MKLNLSLTYLLASAFTLTLALGNTGDQCLISPILLWQTTTTTNKKEQYIAGLCLNTVLKIEQLIKYGDELNFYMNRAIIENHFGFKLSQLEKPAEPNEIHHEPKKISLTSSSPVLTNSKEFSYASKAALKHIKSIHTNLKESTREKLLGLLSTEKEESDSKTPEISLYRSLYETFKDFFVIKGFENNSILLELKDFLIERINEYMKYKPGQHTKPTMDKVIVRLRKDFTKFLGHCSHDIDIHGAIFGLLENYQFHILYKIKGNSENKNNDKANSENENYNEYESEDSENEDNEDKVLSIKLMDLINIQNTQNESLYEVIINNEKKNEVLMSKFDINDKGQIVIKFGLVDDNITKKAHHIAFSGLRLMAWLLSHFVEYKKVEFNSTLKYTESKRSMLNEVKLREQRKNVENAYMNPKPMKLDEHMDLDDIYEPFFKQIVDTISSINQLNKELQSIVNEVAHKGHNEPINHGIRVK